LATTFKIIGKHYFYFMVSGEGLEYYVHYHDFLHVEYNVLSKNVTRDVSQSEKTLSEVI
jgi:hypothetical protein